MTRSLPARLVRILYLEDDPLDVEPVQQRLQAAGLTHELVVASDRKQFESALEGVQFDLILVDYLLPGYDGMAAMAHARQRDPEVPVILISGVIGEEQAVDCVLNGATDYVLKHHLDRLVPATQRALREADERRKRRSAEEALRASEEQYRTIFQTAREAIWVLDRAGKTKLVNARTEQLFGYSAAELSGRLPEECVGGNGAWSSGPSDQAIASGRVASYELALRNKSGATLFTLVSRSELRDNSGEFDGFVLMLTDVTERKLAQEERAELIAQLRRADGLASLGVLAGGMAHDINNLLTPILGVASLNTDSRDERVREDFALIHDAASRGKDMVAKMLDLARPASGAQLPIAVNELVNELVRLLGRTTFAKIRIETELAPSLSEIQGESGALLQALMNLCVNAVDVLEEGGLLSLRTRKSDAGMVQIEVEDSGPGIDEESLCKVSEPFFTTKPDGTGLGLSIVRNIVEAHMGTFEIESRLGRGTRVILSFPELPESGAAAREPRPSHPESSSPPAKADQLHLLVVDDNRVVRQTTERILARLGHTVSCAATGEEALSLLEKAPRPDVVLLDINMPGLGGAGTLRKIRTLHPKLAVALTTGALEPQLLELAEGDSRVSVLPKPFDLGSLQGCIEQLLPKR